MQFTQTTEFYLNSEFLTQRSSTKKADEQNHLTNKPKHRFKILTDLERAQLEKQKQQLENKTNRNSEEERRLLSFKLEEIRSCYQSLRDKYTEDTSSFKSNYNKIQFLQEELSKSQNDLISKNHTLDELNQQINTTKKRSREAFEQEIKDVYQQKKIRYKEKIEDKDQIILFLNKSFEKAKSKSQELYHQYQVAIKEIEKAKSNSIQSNLTHTIDSIEHKNEAQKFKQEIEVLKQKEEEHVAAHNEIQKLTTQIQKLRLAKVKSYFNLTDENQKLKEKFENLQNEKEQNLIKAQNETQKVKEEIDILKQKEENEHTNSQNEIQELQKTIENLKKENEKNITNFSIKIDELKNQNEGLKKEKTITLQKASINHKKWKNIYQALNNQNEELKNQSQESENQLKYYRDRYNAEITYLNKIRETIHKRDNASFLKNTLPLQQHSANNTNKQYQELENQLKYYKDNYNTEVKHLNEIREAIQKRDNANFLAQMPPLQQHSANTITEQK